jgi:hypothetical protein
MRGRCEGLAAIRARGGQTRECRGGEGRAASDEVVKESSNCATCGGRALRYRAQAAAGDADRSKQAVMVNSRARGGGVRSSTGWRVV